MRVALAPEDGTVPLWVSVSTVCTHLQRVRGLVSRRCPWARRVGASAACGCPAGGVRHPPRLPATHVACRDECGVPCPLSIGNPREWTLDPSLVDVRSPPSPARGECRGGACSLRRTPSGSVVESVPRVLTHAVQKHPGTVSLFLPPAPSPSRSPSWWRGVSALVCGSKSRCRGARRVGWRRPYGLSPARSCARGLPG